MFVRACAAAVPPRQRQRQERMLRARLRSSSALLHAACGVVLAENRNSTNQLKQKWKREKRKNLNKRHRVVWHIEPFPIPTNGNEIAYERASIEYESTDSKCGGGRQLLFASLHHRCHLPLMHWLGYSSRPFNGDYRLRIGRYGIWMANDCEKWFSNLLWGYSVRYSLRK